MYDKIEIFIRLFDEHFASYFEIYRRETWRHTGRRTVPQIDFLGDSYPHRPSPPPPASRWPWLNLYIRQPDYQPGCTDWFTKEGDQADIYSIGLTQL